MEEVNSATKDVAMAIDKLKMIAIRMEFPVDGEDIEEVVNLLQLTLDKLVQKI